MSRTRAGSVRSSEDALSLEQRFQMAASDGDLALVKRMFEENFLHNKTALTFYDNDDDLW